MSYSESLTETYSVADIGKVIDCVAADLDMNSQSTGLLTRDQVKNYAADVKALAQKGYLVEANIVLHDSTGTPIRARPGCTRRDKKITRNVVERISV